MYTLLACLATSVFFGVPMEDINVAKIDHKESFRKDIEAKRELAVFALKITVLALAVLFVLLAITLVVDLVGSKIEYTLEAGETLPSSDELSGRDGTEYDFGILNGKFEKVGKYEFQIIDGRRKIKVYLDVVDTKAPKGRVIPLTVSLAGPYPEPDDFFEDIKEASEYYGKVVGSVDLTTLGEKSVVIKLVDEHGNTSEPYSTTVTVIEDKQAPAISAPAGITTYLGEAVSYSKGVTVSDNCFGEVALSINTDGVKLDKVGSYDVIYTATDKAGNRASVTVRLTVLEKRVTRDELMAVVEKKAGELGITEEMSHEEKCKRIYAYVNSPKLSASEANVVFTDESNTDRSDWIREAYLTFERGSGDCYSYFAASKAFFEYFGIENRDIERSKGVKTQSGTHFWSIVNIGTAESPEWYYYDATRLAVKHRTGSGCLFTEAQLVDYNTNVKVGFLTYDHTGYPTVSSKTINENYTW